MNESKLDFDTIIPAAQQGDKGARDQLMLHFYAWSITQARRIIRDSETAKNVALGFWIWLFNGDGLSKYDPEKGSFYTWMRVCIEHRAVDELRRNHRKEPQEPVRATTDLPELSDPVRSWEIKKAIADKLRSPTHKDVFELLMNGASATEIAEELNLSEKRVRNVIGELRAQIREVTNGDA
jgi:RNA polymerase sigma factor (sigma-70 family)